MAWALSRCAPARAAPSWLDHLLCLTSYFSLGAFSHGWNEASGLVWRNPVWCYQGFCCPAVLSLLAISATPGCSGQSIAKLTLLTIANSSACGMLQHLHANGLVITATAAAWSRLNR